MSYEKPRNPRGRKGPAGLPDNTIFTGFKIARKEDERIRMYAFIKQISISRAYRECLYKSISIVPEREEGIQKIIDKLKLDWQMALYDYPFITVKSFCISRSLLLKKSLTEELAKTIMDRLQAEFDFPKKKEDEENE